MVSTASIAPAAPNECPIIPLVELTGTRAEQLRDRFAFRRVIERRGGAVRVDVIDCRWLQSRALQRALHRLARSDPGRIRLGEMMVVGRNAVAADFRQDLRAARLRLLEIFQRKKRRAFAEHKAAARAVEGPALVRRRRLQRIEADKDQFARARRSRRSGCGRSGRSGCIRRHARSRSCRRRRRSR